MNMNKALQHLYKAVSGEDTTKRNISKLLVDIHTALTGEAPENKNNHAKIVDSLAENWSGGGNQNQVQTVAGTLANPWGTSGFYKLLAPAVLSGNASAKMTITMPGLGSVTMPVFAESGGSAGAQLCLKSLYSYTHSAEDGLTAFGLVFARWLGSDYPSNPGPGALNVSLNVQGSSGSYTQTDVISMASSITTSLEVIWHPLPESN